MDVSFILKIAGIGVIVAVINIFLGKTGREDLANMVSIAGVIIAVIILVSKLGEVIKLIEGVFMLG